THVAECPVDGLDRGVDGPDRRRLQQLLHALEVVVEGAAGDAGGADEVVDHRSIGPFLGENSESGREDPLLRARAPCAAHARAMVHLLRPPAPPFHEASRRPTRSAIRTKWASEGACIFCITRARCTFTVRTAIRRSPA